MRKYSVLCIKQAAQTQIYAVVWSLFQELMVPIKSIKQGLRHRFKSVDAANEFQEFVGVNAYAYSL